MKKGSQIKELQGVDVHALLEQHSQEMRERETLDRQPKETREVVKDCRCGGKIIRMTHTEWIFDPSNGPKIIGPGGSNQYRELVIKETYCESCKTMYHNSL